MGRWKGWDGKVEGMGREGGRDGKGEGIVLIQDLVSNCANAAISIINSIGFFFRKFLHFFDNKIKNNLVFDKYLGLTQDICLLKSRNNLNIVWKKYF